MERSKPGTKKVSPHALSHHNQNTIIMNIIQQYSIRNIKKYNEMK